MDAFFASVEQAVNPRLRGKPLIVGSRGKRNHTVVAACSYEAKAYGIKSGMPTFMALGLCPCAEFIPADSAKYMYTSEEIFKMIKDYSWQAETASIDEFYLDVSICGLGKAITIAQDIKQKIKSRFSITCSIGIAPSKIIAKIAAKSKKPDGLVVLEEKDIMSFLKDLPVEKVPGIGESTKKRLNYMSIFTCAELARVETGFLIERFGKIGLWLSEVSRGIDNSEVAYLNEGETQPKSIGHSYTLERQIYNRGLILAWIRMLSEMVAYRLRKDCLQAHVTHLYISGSLGFLNRQKKFSSPTYDPQDIYLRCQVILESFDKKQIHCRALGVSASGLVPAQPFHLFDQDEKRERLISARDKINERFGEWTIYPASISEVK
jgi:DNA polymerase-4